MTVEINDPICIVHSIYLTIVNCGMLLRTTLCHSLNLHLGIFNFFMNLM